MSHYIEIKQQIHQKIFEDVWHTLQTQSHSTFSELSLPEIERRVVHILDSYNTHIPHFQRKKLITEIVHRVIGMGPLQELLDDDSITEIMVNGANEVYVEKSGVIYKTDIIFESDEIILHIIQRIVHRIGRRIDESSPMVDARLPDGSRVNAIIPPVSLHGPVLTIRKFPEYTFTLKDLEKKASMDANIRMYLAKKVKEKNNILISGGTGSGKTSLLNALSDNIPDNERIITIEDSAELRLHHDHIISLESRPANFEGSGEINIRTLVKNALRMRPDRIIVGEIRGAEALDMLQAMNTGHKGSLTTIHANAPLEALFRLETMVLMSELELPLDSVRRQIMGAIDIVIQIERDAEGKRRVKQIIEIPPLSENTGNQDYNFTTVFSYNNNRFIAH